MDTMLIHGNYGFAKMYITNLQGENGLGFYRLIIKTKIFWNEKHDNMFVKLSDLNGELLITFPNGERKYVGRVHYQLSQSELKSKEFSYDDYLNFEIELDRTRIEAIEDGRKGADFNIEFIMKARGKVQNDSRLIEAKLNYQINQSSWIQVLREMNYRKMLLLEIPLEMNDNSDTLKDVVSYLKEAKNFFVNGKYRDSIGSCRDVLESLTSIIGDEKLLLPDEIKVFFNYSKDLDKAERIKLLHRAVKMLTHPARHVDEVSKNFDWNMIDSRAVLAITAALIQMSLEDSVK